MTTALSRAKWSWTPSFTELWLEAMLRAFAMLMVHVAATFQMSFSRRARECDAMPAPVALPGETRDILENHLAAERSKTHKALMVSSTRSVRPSNHEGELTADCGTERTKGPRPRRRVRCGLRSRRIDPVDQFERRTPSNHLKACSDLRPPPHGGTSLILTRPRPSPGTRPHSPVVVVGGGGLLLAT